MRIKSIKISNFRRFSDLTIQNLPPAKLIVLAGPNGAGKSSLFDAFSLWHQITDFGGWHWDGLYYSRKDEAPQWQRNVEIEFHDTRTNPKTGFYVRTAYRNDPQFALSTLARQDSLTDLRRSTKMIDNDASVSNNYQRLASSALEDIFAGGPNSKTVDEFREEYLKEIRLSLQALFPDLFLTSFGNPLSDGSFKFSKGSQTNFDYRNLSGGEKSAFDLILDLVVKRKAFNDTVFAIDEPEAHMNTRIQGSLLEQLYNLIPGVSQLWISTHSIGMMRKARQLHAQSPNDVLFLDFGGRDFDRPVVIEPAIPSRSFWETTLRIALDDLSDLVAPNRIVLCGGNPKGPVSGKNEEHDARCYERIFADEFPDTTFISAGSSKEVVGDRLRLVATLAKIAKGMTIRRLIDRDDHAPDDVVSFKKSDIAVLRRRNIESYLYDLEVLSALYEKHGRADAFSEAERAYHLALQESARRRNPPDDIKSAARDIYTFVKSHLALTACGDDQASFARSTLAPLMNSKMNVYKELREDIFAI